MNLLARLLRGWRGHPAHPPLTDVTMGASTVGAVAVIAGLLGFLEARMVNLAFLALAVGLISSVLTILTGVVDYVRIARGSPLRRTATLHWVVQVIATAMFLVAAALLQPARNAGAMPWGGGLVALAAWAALTFGSWVGGALVFVHGMRVLGEPDAPTREALKPKWPPD
ncbi:MAG: DUF2231 domain-containing protein [Actinomycetota bacterium]|nr:DUF2231 domain-containing protein [Actinomycetota bacterium]